MVSGHSVLGALEYDQALGLIKCHECGGWIKAINNHLKLHFVSTSEYRQKHGFTSTTSLATPEVKEKRATQLYGNRSQAENIRRLIACNAAPKGPRSRKQNMEMINQAGRCRAQILFKIQMLAAGFGRTPTLKELAGSGVHGPAMYKWFGSYHAAIREAGLLPRPPSCRYSAAFNAPLPVGFPSKEQLLESRMPWPSDYFGVRPAQASALSSISEQ